MKEIIESVTDVKSNEIIFLLLLSNGDLTAARRQSSHRLGGISTD